MWDKYQYCGAQIWKPMDKQRRTKVPYNCVWYLPINERLNRMYQRKKTAASMRWHAEPQIKEREIGHQSNVAEWKNFQDLHLRFVEEPRNVYSGFTNGFNSLGMSRNHFLRHVILTTYILSWVCAWIHHNCFFQFWILGQIICDSILIFSSNLWLRS